jgi:hypothetical protein
MNWAGKPLTSLEVILAYIRGTKTEAGLTVEAVLLDGEFMRRETVTKKEMEE